MNFDTEITVGNRLISPQSSTFIIAEAGVNHGGNMADAKKLIDVAVGCGADAVKFQAFHANHLLLENVEKAPYQKSTTGNVENQYEMIRKLEIGTEQNKELSDYCKEKNIIFLTTPFDEVSLSELDVLDLPAYKVASTDATNLPFLRKIASKGKPLFLSTGMTFFSEIEKVLREISRLNSQVILMQCTANYPTSENEANLAVLNTFKDRFAITVGFSDHTAGIGAGPFAVAMGAKLVEKHFTLDKAAEGPDHEASLGADELTEYIAQIRKVEAFLGTGEKRPTLAEIQTRNSLQKCLVTTKALNQGSTLKDGDLIGKRTGGSGISPIYIDELIGQRVGRDFGANEVFEQ